MTRSPLPRTGFLASASDDLRDMLDALSSDVALAKGEVLFEKGDEGDALYAIISGSIECSVLSREGRKLSLDVMLAGALFGEIALFDPGPRTATATALEPTQLRVVRNADVLQAVRAAPDLAVDMIQLAGERLRWMSRQLNEQVFLPLPARLARKILHLTMLNAEEKAELPLSQAELADFVGATREAVSKTMSSWKSARVIDASRGGLRVLNRDALQKISDFHLI